MPEKMCFPCVTVKFRSRLSYKEYTSWHFCFFYKCFILPVLFSNSFGNSNSSTQGCYSIYIYSFSLSLCTENSYSWTILFWWCLYTRYVQHWSRVLDPQEAGNNERVRQVYRAVAAVHEGCGELVDIVRETGTVQREISELKEQVRQWNVFTIGQIVLASAFSFLYMLLSMC